MPPSQANDRVWRPAAACFNRCTFVLTSRYEEVNTVVVKSPVPGSPLFRSALRLRALSSFKLQFLRRLLHCLNPGRTSYQAIRESRDQQPADLAGFCIAEPQHTFVDSHAMDFIRCLYSDHIIYPSTFRIQQADSA